MKTMQLTIVLLLMVGLSTPFTAQGAEIQVGASAVTTTNLNMRAGPDTGAQILGSVPAGGSVFVRSGPHNGVWYAATFQGVSGYVHGEYLQGSGPAAPPQVAAPVGIQVDSLAVATTAVNLRAAPDTAAQILGSVPAGGSVFVRSGPHNGVWYAATFQGVSGYVHGGFLQAAGSAAPPPVAPAVGIQVDSLAVTTTAVNLRAGPSTATQALKSIPAGGSVLVRSGPHNGVWYAVTFAGVSGYVHGGYLQAAGSARPSQVVTSTDVAVRAGPDPASAVLGVVPRGMRVTIGEKPVAGGWRQVTYGGISGYVLSDAFVRTLGNGGAKRITVDLSEQRLYAYEGGQVVLTVPVATGRDGFETPIGIHRVQWKAALRNMRGSSNGQTWDVPNVPHAMYITSSGVALHGTYWHNLFGSGARPSHGCVNLPLEAAALLYDWVLVGTTVEVRD